LRARAVPTAALPTETVAEAVAYIAENLRPADAAELEASHGGDPREVLAQSWHLSDLSWLILDRTGLPIGIFGVAPGPAPGVGIVWLMGTAGIEEEFVAVARQTRQFVGEMLAAYPTLWNFIDARNELSLRWLLWSGFHIIDVAPFHGPEQRTFFEFARIA
jgi:hypothetical protein